MLETTKDWDSLESKLGRGPEFPWDDVPAVLKDRACSLADAYEMEAEAFLLVEMTILGFLWSRNLKVNTTLGEFEPPLINTILTARDDLVMRHGLKRVLWPLDELMDEALALRSEKTLEEIGEMFRSMKEKNRDAKDEERLKVAMRLAKLKFAESPIWMSSKACFKAIEEALGNAHDRRVLLDYGRRDHIAGLLMNRSSMTEKLVRGLEMCFREERCQLSGPNEDCVAALWMTEAQQLADWNQVVRRRLGSLRGKFIFYPGHIMRVAPSMTSSMKPMPEDEIWNGFIRTLVAQAVWGVKDRAPVLSDDARTVLLEFRNEVMGYESKAEEDSTSVAHFVSIAERLAAIFNTIDARGDEIHREVVEGAVKVARWYCHRHLDCLAMLPPSAESGARKPKTERRSDGQILLDKLRASPDGLTFREICRKYNRPERGQLRRLLKAFMERGKVQLQDNRYCVVGLAVDEPDYSVSDLIRWEALDNRRADNADTAATASEGYSWKDGDEGARIRKIEH